MTEAILLGRPDAGNLLYKSLKGSVCCVFVAVCAAFAVRADETASCAPLVLCAGEGEIAKWDPNMAQQNAVVTNGVRWIDGKDLPIEGRAFNDTEHYYDRLPRNVRLCEHRSPGRVVETNYEPFIRNFRAKRPGVPIVMAEQCDGFCRGPNEKDVFMRKLYEKLVAEGWKDLVYLPKDGMYSDDLEGTVDGTHPNDWGMMHLAKAFEGAVRKALKLRDPDDIRGRSQGNLRENVAVKNVCKMHAMKTMQEERNRQ